MEQKITLDLHICRRCLNELRNSNTLAQLAVAKTYSDLYLKQLLRKGAPKLLVGALQGQLDCIYHARKIALS